VLPSGLLEWSQREHEWVFTGEAEDVFPVSITAGIEMVD